MNRATALWHSLTEHFRSNSSSKYGKCEHLQSNGLTIIRRNLNKKSPVEDDDLLNRALSPAEIEVIRDALAEGIQQHYADIETFAPALISLDLVAKDPAQDRIVLPSQFAKKTELDALGLNALAHIERTLRIGRAHDALDGVRKGLGLAAFLGRRLQEDQAGLTNNEQKAMRTRAQVAVDRAKGVSEYWADVYRDCWTALQALGEQEAKITGLRILHPDDTKMLSTWVHAGKWKKHSAPLSWIWTTLNPAVPERGEQTGIDTILQGWNDERKYC